MYSFGYRILNQAMVSPIKIDTKSTSSSSTKLIKKTPPPTKKIYQREIIRNESKTFRHHLHDEDIICEYCMLNLQYIFFSGNE